MAHRHHGALAAALLCLALVRSASSQAMVPFLTGTATIVYNFDVLDLTQDGYIVSINAHSGDPACDKIVGWALAWEFPKDQVVWGLSGASVEYAGDCSQVKIPGNREPYSCNQFPMVYDERFPDFRASLARWTAPRSICKAQACGPIIGSIRMVVGNMKWEEARSFPRPFLYRMPKHTCSSVTVTPTKMKDCTTKPIFSWRVTCAPIDHFKKKVTNPKKPAPPKTVPKTPSPKKTTPKKPISKKPITKKPISKKVLPKRPTPKTIPKKPVSKKINPKRPSPKVAPEKPTPSA